MTNYPADIHSIAKNQWLTRYYFARTAFSAVWVLAAFTVGQQTFPVASALLVIYPAWDAAANFVDASRTGGLVNNPTQAINVAVSLVTTAAVVIALTMSMNWVLGVFGLWAILSGLLQLGTASVDGRRTAASGLWSSAAVSPPLRVLSSSYKRKCRNRHPSPTSRDMRVSGPFTS